MIPEAHLQSACCDLIADVARNQGKVHLKVAGASMVPALWPGDLVTVRRCDPEELQPGSIVVFRQNERLVVHRLMHWQEGCVVTRGDSHPCLDRPTPAGEVIGRVESIQRDGRRVSRKAFVPAEGGGLGFAALASGDLALYARGEQDAEIWADGGAR